MNDPHDGLAMFGPYDSDLPGHPRSISYGLVATDQGASAFAAFSRAMASAINCPDDLDRRLWPTFPGFEAAFASSWPASPTRTSTVDTPKLADAVNDADPNKRAAAVADLYLAAIEAMAKRDDAPDVIVCIVPDAVHANCRPKSRLTETVGYRPSARVRTQRLQGQTDMFDPYDPEIYQYSVDFRRQIKARSMKHGIPIQIIRHSTLALRRTNETTRNVTPLNDRAWNLAVALFYKAGGKPWRLHTARPGVCYIGISYRRRDKKSESKSACCAAQMFLDTGDGLVFLGEYGPWYSAERNAFHLERPAAKRLLQNVLQTYSQLEGKELREIFLHCRSTINREEFAGFQDACPKGVRLVGIRVRQERFDVRLFREGSYPVARGTFWPVSQTKGYLWASGFKPRLATYDGWETPAPLRIEIQHGDADLNQVATDIFGLTKLNYNTCKLGDSQPVTIGFSDAVGEILVSNPSVADRRPNFKFYI